MLRLVYPPFTTGRGALALLIVRVVFGVALVLHGLPKTKNPMHWMDGMSDAAPAPLQLASVCAEVGGGAAIALGLCTPLAALLLAINMGVALSHHLGHGDPFVGPGKPSWESAAGYEVVALALLLAGPGRWSADYFLLGKRRGELPPA